MFSLERIDHVAITVRDIGLSAKWYMEVLGLERYFEEAWNGIPTMVGKGGTCLALFKAKGENPNSSPGSDTYRMTHLAFNADRKNFEEAQKSFKEKGINFEFEDHDISHSIYFKDPDGHRLEITTYEV
ncbi:MAG: VOC family protein [Ignavibacteria bacterium]